MLELAEIQGTVLCNRPLPYYGAYLLFRIVDPGQAYQLIERLLPQLTSAADWRSPRGNAWINLAFSWRGLARLGLPDEILQGFPSEFRQGMAARHQFLGDVGFHHPDYWDIPHGENGLHAGLFIMAASPAGREEKLRGGHAALAGLPGVLLTHRVDLGVPSNHREHFGYVDGISRPYIEGEGGSPLPGQGEPVRAGEFVLGYTNELGRCATGPGPAEFWRNGTYLSVRKLRQDVAAFRRFLLAQPDPELTAAKIMGRWRSGCPLALSPDRDRPELAADIQKNNNFLYYADDPGGRKTPTGCHIRRVNPRDGLQDSITEARLHRLLRRGSAYGPELAEGLLEDDGVDRGILLAFVNADPGRQFEFVQSQWVQDGDFISQGSRSDPVVGRRDRADDFTYPARPARRRLQRLGDFTLTRGGEHVFLPGLNGIRWLLKQSSANR